MTLLLQHGKTVLFCALALLFAACSSPSGSPSPSPSPNPGGGNRQWSTLGLAAVSEGAGFGPSLAVGTDGAVYVSYSDTAQGGKTTVQKYNGTSWQVVGVAGFGPSGIPRITLAEAPYVVYLDSSQGNKASSMRFNGTAWEQAGDAGFSPGSTDSSVSAAAGGGALYTAFKMDNPNDDDFHTEVFQFVGGDWNSVTPTNLFGELNYQWPSSLVVDSTGTPFIAGYDGANAGKATVLKRAGATWVTVGPAGFTPADVFEPALALDSANRLYMAYIQDSTQAAPKVTVMKFSGTAWNVVGTPGISPATVESTLMAIDSFDVPFVCYVATADAAPYPIQVLLYDGANWVPAGTDGNNVGTIQSVVGTAFAAGPSGAVYLAFVDHDNDDKITVKVFR